ncbi:MAG: hypothetical protein ACFFDT_25540 [Candidatus Hodarchaeota archaeon]
MLLFPESALPQLTSLGISTSKGEPDEKFVVELPRQFCQDKNLLIELFKLAYESN